MGDSILYCDSCTNQVGCHLARECFLAKEQAECDTCHHWEWNNGRLGFASGYCLLFDKVTHKQEGSECPAWEQVNLENRESAATEGCAAAAGYVAALEDALAAAIVSLYTTDKEDCLRAFHLDELEGALERTQAITAETRLEDVYAKALRYPRPHTTTKCSRPGGLRNEDKTGRLRPVGCHDWFFDDLPPTPMTETHIRTAAKLFDARDAMRRLHGDNWPQKINEISPIIRGVAKEGKTSILAAAIQIAEKASKDGQPMASVMVLAVACELSENDLRQARAAQDVDDTRD